MSGQEHVLRALSNALSAGRVHHAFLFTGTRGVGKTTIARIFAKCLNCERGQSATPCGECATCIDIDAGRFVDLIEVDAAFCVECYVRQPAHLRQNGIGYRFHHNPVHYVDYSGFVENRFFRSPSLRD